MAPESIAPARRAPGLSPSRANDFARCPLLFRFRVVDRLPEPPSSAAARGTLVHAVLDKVFDLPAAERTPLAARKLLGPAWDELQVAEPSLASLFTDDDGVREWLTSAGTLLETYFRLEDPRRLEPAERETYLEVGLEDGPLLRGVVDRIDVAPDGAVRVVDYKTGKAPAPRFQHEALFQVRFYGLMLWRARGQVPRRLQLVYLGDGQVLHNDPAPSDLEEAEREVRATWEAIRQAGRRGDFPTRRGPLCAWCAHQAVCPEFGGTPPPLDPTRVELTLGVRPDGPA